MSDAAVIRSHAGSAIEPLINDVARLRTQVFSEWPYLYAGDDDYERVYLAKYARTPGALLVTASDPATGAIVGASTALPLTAAEPALRAPFLAHGLDPITYYYFGESVLDPAWRGRGIGVSFFAAREAEAFRLGFVRTTFCAVVRPANHPARPAGYVPLDAFWTKRGYIRRPELRALLGWRDIGEEVDTEKPMVFWTRQAD